MDKCQKYRMQPFIVNQPKEKSQKRSRKKPAAAGTAAPAAAALAAAPAAVVAGAPDLPGVATPMTGSPAPSDMASTVDVEMAPSEASVEQESLNQDYMQQMARRAQMAQHMAMMGTIGMSAGAFLAMPTMLMPTGMPLDASHLQPVANQSNVAEVAASVDEQDGGDEESSVTSMEP